MSSGAGRDIPARIEAGDLALRIPEGEDVDAIVAGCQDPEIARWTRVPSPYGPDDAREYLALARRERAEGSGAHYLIVDSVDDTLLGAAGLVRIDHQGRMAQVGYWLTRAARGRGVATRAVGALVDHAFDMGMLRIEAQVMVGNDSSCRVLSRLGFVEEGIRRSVPARGCGVGPDRIDVHIFSQIPADRA